ncbi:MAG: hypothetical protein ACJAUV_001012 [Flavobacteriales bacterium]|jgi:hypothetical protein
MDSIKRNALILAAFPMTGKLVGYATDVSASSSQTFFILLHILLLLVGVFLTLRLQPSQNSFLEDVKMGMKTVGLYSISNALFLYIFYKFIDVTYFATKIADMVDKTDLSAARKTAEEVSATYETFFTAFNWSTLSLVAWMVMGLIYTVLLTLLHRKVLRKFQ